MGVDGGESESEHTRDLCVLMFGLGVGSGTNGFEGGCSGEGMEVEVEVEG